MEILTMEEEQGDVGAGGGVFVSKLSLSGELSREFLVESMSCGNKVEESYEEGDEGEIMVEIVVNGINARDGVLESNDWENREANESRDVSVDVWNEGDGSRMGESELRFLESKVVGIVGEDAWNHEVEAMVVHSSAVMEYVTKQTEEDAETDCDVGEVGLVNSNGGGVVLAIDSHNDGAAKDENANPDVDCGMEAKIVHGKEVSAAESKDSIVVESHTFKTILLDVNEEKEFGGNCYGGKKLDCGPAELVTKECSSENDKFKLSDEVTVMPASFVRMHQPGFLSSSEYEDRFAQLDLVLGKVWSHPLWPGQIFDQADASEKALKNHRACFYLVACFGDLTFGWSDASVLKPFTSHFSQIEN